MPPKVPQIRDHVKIVFEKNVKGKRLRVRESTVKQCMQNMKKKETEFLKGIVEDGHHLLQDEMDQWIRYTKRVTLKPSRYMRIMSTFNTHIKGTRLGKMQVQAVSDAQIQNVLLAMNKNGFAWSTIKKVYDLLNDFFRTYAERKSIKNPMTFVTMISKENTKPIKEIQYFDEKSISAFVAECVRKQKNTLGYKHRSMGWVYLAMLYMGMRGGEMVALKWKDVDFDNRYIHITGTMGNVKLPDENGHIGKGNYVNVDGSTKNTTTRLLYMTDDFKIIFEEIQKYNLRYPNRGNTDRVCLTNRGNINTVSNMDKTLNYVCRDAGIELKNGSIGVHTLCHTFATLMLRYRWKSFRMR